MIQLKDEFADWCSSSKEEIVEAWSESVRSDPLLETDDSLSYEDFVDFIPKILEEICRQARDAETAWLELEKSGSLHGAFRWEKGYHLAEVLREIAHLRQILLDLAGELGERVGSSHTEQRDLTGVILRTLDEVEIGAALSYVAKRDGELMDRIRELRKEID